MFQIQGVEFLRRGQGERARKKANVEESIQYPGRVEFKATYQSGMILKVTSSFQYRVSGFKMPVHAFCWTIEAGKV